jgi:hypothetical protein
LKFFETFSKSIWPQNISISKSSTTKFQKDSFSKQDGIYLWIIDPSTTEPKQLGMYNKTLKEMIESELVIHFSLILRFTSNL